MKADRGLRTALTALLILATAGCAAIDWRETGAAWRQSLCRADGDPWCADPPGRAGRRPLSGEG